MANDPVLDRILDEIERSGFGARARRMLETNKRSLMNDGETPKQLLKRIAETSQADWPASATVLQQLLDESRMDIENRGAHGSVFLKAAEDEIARCVSAGSLGGGAANLIGVCYTRSYLDVPVCLINQRLSDIEHEMKGKPQTPPDIKKLIKKMVKESQGDVYAVFERLREILAGIPADMGNTVIYGICSEDIGYSGSLATYWLLAQDESARERAATALLQSSAPGQAGWCAGPSASDGQELDSCRDGASDRRRGHS